MIVNEYFYKVHKCMSKNREYVKRSRLRRNVQQIYRDSNRYKTSFSNYMTRLIGTSKHEDKNKNRDFNINRNFLFSLLRKQEGKCVFTNLLLKHDGSLYSTSIDRIDNGVGHVRDNVQLVCMGINLARNNASCSDASFLIKCIRDVNLFVPINKWSRDYVSIICRNNSCDFSADYVMELFKKQDGRCALSGIQMCPYKHPCLSISIDRIDPHIGHVVGNVRLVVKALNRARKNRDDEEFLTFLKDIRNS